MLGAILGDMIGSPYEFNVDKKPMRQEIDLYGENNRMTDDSYLTLAVAKVLLKHYPFHLDDKEKLAIQDDLRKEFKDTVAKHPFAGFGASFYKWANLPLKDMRPYNSCANGSAMRISSVGWLASSLTEVRELSLLVSDVTHNHPDAIKGAEAIASCIYFALKGYTKEQIRDYVELNYYPSIRDFDYESLVENYAFDVFCEGSCPQAIYCFLISDSLEDAILKAICIGGDSDTIACMCGGIAEAFYNRDSVSPLERHYLDFYLEREEEDIIKKIHQAIGSRKFG